MIEIKVFATREEWLEARSNYIGGSDAADVLGQGYKSNTELWALKTGRTKGKDISDLPFVKYGTEAEQHLRALFALDYPEYTVHYEENNMWLNTEYPWAHYSADGWLVDGAERLGILEIKTTEILRTGQKDQWKNQIPQNYYIQLLHGFAVTGAEFAVLKGQLKYRIDGKMWLNTVHHEIERSEVITDIDYLMQAEKRFWQDVKNDTMPNRILPEF